MDPRRSLEDSAYITRRILELHKEGVKTWEIQRKLYDEGHIISYSWIGRVIRLGGYVKKEKNLLEGYTDDWLEEHAIKHESIARRYRKEQERRQTENESSSHGRDGAEL